LLIDNDDGDDGDDDGDFLGGLVFLGSDVVNFPSRSIEGGSVIGAMVLPVCGWWWW